MIVRVGGKVDELFDKVSALSSGPAVSSSDGRDDSTAVTGLVDEGASLGLVLVNDV